MLKQHEKFDDFNRKKKTKVFVLFKWIQTIPPAKTIYEVTVYMLKNTINIITL